MMTSEAVQELLKKEIRSLGFEIHANDVYQFDLERHQIAPYLEDHPELPFIFSKSAIDGYFSLNIPDKERKSIRCIPVLQSKANETKFLCRPNRSVSTEDRDLKEYVQAYWDPGQKRLLSDSELAEIKNKLWENYQDSKQKEYERKQGLKVWAGKSNEEKIFSIDSEVCLETAIPKTTQADFDLFRDQNRPSQSSFYPGQQGPGFFHGQPVQQGSGFYQGQRVQQGPGFFHGQPMQQNTQQGWNYYPQQNQGQNWNNGF